MWFHRSLHSSASAERIEKLIRERTVQGASKLDEDTAKAWEILVTGPVERAAAAFPGVAFEPIDSVPPGTDSAFKGKYGR